MIYTCIKQQIYEVEVYFHQSLALVYNKEDSPVLYDHLNSKNFAAEMCHFVGMNYHCIVFIIHELMWNTLLALRRRLALGLISLKL